jgi:hypothetical protein
MWPVCMWPGESACSFLRRRGGASSSISSSYETCRWDFAPKPPCVDWEGPGIFVCSSARARQQERNQKIKFFFLHPFLKGKKFPEKAQNGPAYHEVSSCACSSRRSGGAGTYVSSNILRIWARYARGSCGQGIFICAGVFLRECILCLNRRSLLSLSIIAEG